MTLYLSACGVALCAWAGMAWRARRIPLLVVLNLIVCTQVAGTLFMELGGFGVDVGEFGYSNGATLALALTMLAVNTVGAMLPWRLPIPPLRRMPRIGERPVVLLFLALGVGIVTAAVTVYLGAPLLTGASDIARVTALQGRGALNVARGYILPALSAAAWYSYRAFVSRTRLRRIALASLMGILCLNAALIASKSAIVAFPLGIALVELGFVVREGWSWRRRLFATIIGIAAVMYMVVIRYLHAEGRMTLREASISLGVRTVVGQGDVFWKIGTEPGALEQESGRIWANLIRVPGLVDLPHEDEFYNAVATRYAGGLFAEYWNLVSTFLGEPVLLFGWWAVPVYGLILIAVIVWLHTLWCHAAAGGHTTMLAVVTIYMYGVVDYWQMGGLYRLFGLQSVLLAALTAALVEASRLPFAPTQRSYQKAYPYSS